MTITNAPAPARTDDRTATTPSATLVRRAGVVLSGGG
jgi:hypothetical protein